MQFSSCFVVQFKVQPQIISSRFQIFQQNPFFSDQNTFSFKTSLIQFYSTHGRIPAQTEQEFIRFLINLNLQRTIFIEYRIRFIFDHVSHIHLIVDSNSTVRIERFLSCEFHLVKSHEKKYYRVMNPKGIHLEEFCKL